MWFFLKNNNHKEHKENYTEDTEKGVTFLINHIIVRTSLCSLCKISVVSVVKNLIGNIYFIK